MATPAIRAVPLLLGAFLGAAVTRPGAAVAEPAGVRVKTTDALRRALADAKPGTRILVTPGSYEGGVSAANLQGSEHSPIVIAAADPANPPRFMGGGSGLHLSDVGHLVLERLEFEGAKGNGVNIDDGGTIDSPSHHVVLRHLTVRDVGPDGNCDGIKLSGVDDVAIESCTVERWGSSGSAVDMVGCHRGTIEASTFRGVEGAGSAGSGVQMKGGTRDVAVRRCRFEHAGGRAVNAGGSTGLAYFRPPLTQAGGPRHEAKDLRIEGNTILGSDAAIAFVGVDGAVVRFNTIYLPRRWAMRILEETREPQFVPCRGGVVTDNVFVFLSDRWSEGGCNVGPGTEPATFQFARNVWWCADAPARTRALVRLPTPEKDGVYGEDPGLVDPPGDLRGRPGGPATKAGADAMPRGR